MKSGPKRGKIRKNAVAENIASRVYHSRIKHDRLLRGLNLSFTPVSGLGGPLSRVAHGHLIFGDCGPAREMRRTVVLNAGGYCALAAPGKAKTVSVPPSDV